MKKFKFSKNDLNNRMKKIKNFMRRHYVIFFKETPLLFCFIVSALINTILLRVITVGNFSYLKPLFADLGMLFIFSAFMFLFKTDKGRRRYLIFFSIFSAIICIINSLYYTYYASFASVSLLATSTFVVDVGDAVVDQVLNLRDFVYLWQPIFICYCCVRDKRRSKADEKDDLKNKKEEVNLDKEKENIKTKDGSYKSRRFCFINMFVTGFVVLLITGLTMTSTEWSRFGKLWNRESVVSSFGIYTYQINDIFQSLEPKINNLFGHDSALKQVTDYYEENEVSTTENEYTGIFEGMNVIVIHAESLQSFVINKSFNDVEVTPTLNKIASEGIYFSNFYSQVGVGTSSDAEFTFSTSLMPSSNGTVFVNYFDREYQTIQKAFKSEGYYVFSMHANTADFWNRATMHKNMGYDDFYSKSSFDIDETIGLGLSDKSFFRQAVPMIRDIIENKNQPFYGTLITLSNHTPWNDLELMDEYDTTWTIEVDGEEIVRDYLSDTTLGDYLTSVHYMDQALEQFLNDMDEQGLLDNTVVIIYGDHDARISSKYYNLMYNYDPYSDTIKEDGDEGYIDYNEYEYKLDKSVPFIIWTKDTEFNVEVTTPAGMIDAYPTLANMFGLETNEFQLGHDIMSITDGDNTVVFTDGSYLTSKIYYNGQNSEIYSISGEAVDENYIQSNAEYASAIIEVSNNIITYDLISEIKNKDDEE